MRAQLKNLLDFAVDATHEMEFPNMIFVLGIVTLALYIFIYTQGVSPYEQLGEKGVSVAQDFCSQPGNEEVYTSFCKGYVCGTLDEKKLENWLIPSSGITGISCSASSTEPEKVEAFIKFTDQCSKYCLKGIFDVRGVARQAEGAINFAFGKYPKYCVFLKTGAMMSSVIPRCTPQGILDGGERLCARGFKCYLYMSKQQCDCDDVGIYVNGTAADLSSVSSLTCAGDEFEFNPTNANAKSDYTTFATQTAFPTQSTDTSWENFVSQKFPTPICVIFFGLLPFGIIYFLLLDLLYFIPLADTPKSALAVLVSMFSIIMGTYSNIVLMITKLAGWSLSTSFLICLFGSGMVGAILKNMIQSMAVKQKVNKELMEFAGGLGELTRPETSCSHCGGPVWEGDTRCRKCKKVLP